MQNIVDVKATRKTLSTHLQMYKKQCPIERQSVIYLWFNEKKEIVTMLPCGKYSYFSLGKYGHLYALHKNDIKCRNKAVVIK